MKPLDYSGITRQRFDEIAQRAEAETGLALHGDSGAASAKGFTVRWQYDESRQALSLIIDRTPWGMAAIARAKLREVVEQ